MIDLEAGTVSTVTFSNPEALQIGEAVTVVGGGSTEESIVLPAQTIAAGEGEVVLRIALPEGFKVNDLIDSVAMFSSADEAIQIPDGDASQVVDAREVRLPVAFGEGSDTLYAVLTIYYCLGVFDPQFFKEAQCLLVRSPLLHLQPATG